MWVASKHFLADNSIKQVWYLPQGAPPEEIRFLEVSDRVTRDGDGVEAIDFNLDVEGVNFRLFVADLTTEELEQVRRDPTRLPRGWILDGATVSGRRGRTSTSACSSFKRERISQFLA